MVRTELVRNHGIQFDETPVANDAMFSTKVGHYARRVTACGDVVYMITEGEKGLSLTKARNAENQFIRFQVAVRRYLFVKAVGHMDQRPKIRGFITHALMEFGPKEAIRYWRYARENDVSLF